MHPLPASQFPNTDTSILSTREEHVSNYPDFIQSALLAVDLSLLCVCRNAVNV